MNLIIVIHKMSSDTQTSWNDPSNADNPQADYGYIPNDTTKEGTSFYHLIPRVFNTVAQGCTVAQRCLTLLPKGV